MRNGPYILVVAPANYPGKKYRDRYVYEHQLVWWQMTGEVVRDGYVIHHKDENKHNNEFSNLEHILRVAHHKIHAMLPAIAKHVCGWCGNEFEKRARVMKQRLRKSMSGKVFCCKSCQVKEQRRQATIAK